MAFPPPSSAIGIGEGPCSYNQTPKSNSSWEYQPCCKTCQMFDKEIPRVVVVKLFKLSLNVKKKRSDTWYQISFVRFTIKYSFIICSFYDIDVTLLYKVSHTDFKI
jgi:hypothetical protein